MKNQARTLSNNGHDVEILCFKSDMEKPDDVGVSQFGLAMNPPYSEIDKLISVFSIRGLRIMNKMRRADIIIAHRFPFTIFAWICSKIFDSKYILWSWPSGPSMEKF
jgi:1,2-diacylglycerol 3-alpha-glucosyltransferase